MYNTPFRTLAASALAATLAFASPAQAFHGGGGGGGMHGGGMSGGMGGGWSHAGGVGSHLAMEPYSRAAFSPRFPHFAFRERDSFRRDFLHHRFHRFAFFGVPYDYAYYGYDACLRQVWTRYGLQWVNVCGNYAY